MTSAFRFNEREIFDFSTSLRGNNKDGSGHDFFKEKIILGFISNAIPESPVRWLPLN